MVRGVVVIVGTAVLSLYVEPTGMPPDSVWQPAAQPQVPACEMPTSLDEYARCNAVAPFVQHVEGNVAEFWRSLNYVQNHPPPATWYDAASGLCERFRPGACYRRRSGPNSTGHIFFERSYMRDNFNNEPWLAAFVVAHEWGHWVQDEVEELRALGPQRAREHQADCLAGAYSRYVWQREPNAFGSTQDRFMERFEDAASALSGWGEPGDRYNPLSSHGSGGQRSDIFRLGFQRAADWCLGSAFLSRVGTTTRVSGSEGWRAVVVRDYGPIHYGNVKPDRANLSGWWLAYHTDPAGLRIHSEWIEATSANAARVHADRQIAELRSGRDSDSFKSDRIEDRSGATIGAWSRWTRSNSEITFFLYYTTRYVGLVWGPTGITEELIEILVPLEEPFSTD